MKKVLKLILFSTAIVLSSNHAVFAGNNLNQSKANQKIASHNINWPSWFDPTQFGSCRWRGSAPICKGNCAGNETEIVKDHSGGGKSCVTGAKAYCCVPK